MKTVITILISLVFSLSAQSQCAKVFDFKEGTYWNWTNYNKKGKRLGRTIQKVEKASIDGNSRSLKITKATEDAKGRQRNPVTMVATCQNGVVQVDLRKYLPPEQLQVDGLGLIFTGTNLEMPSDMKVGDRLKDAAISLNKDENSSGKKNMTVSVTERRVIGEEKLNTSKGGYDCLIIEQKIEVNGKKSLTRQTKEWYAVGVGIVKVENYRKGKLLGYSILTTFTQ